MGETWYLKDGKGAQIGPVSRQLAAELLRSKPGVFVHASRDGVTWQVVRSHAATTAFAGQEGAAAKLAREAEAVQRVEMELDRYRELAPHHLFSVPKGADVRAHRQGFLALAAKYHPGRQPKDVSPALLKAHVAMFQYLSEVMDTLERTAQEAPPVQKAPTAPPPGPSLEPAQGEWPLEALSPRNSGDGVSASLGITRANAFIFTAHRLINLANQGVFFPCMPPLALGTKMDLRFQFLDAHREVVTKGAVAYENAGSTVKQALRGFGVRLEQLSSEDRGFMLREVRRLELASP